MATSIIKDVRITFHSNLSFNLKHSNIVIAGTIAKTKKMAPFVRSNTKVISRKLVTDANNPIILPKRKWANTNGIAEKTAKIKLK